MLKSLNSGTFYLVRILFSWLAMSRQSEKKVGRRTFLKLASGGAALVIAATTGYSKLKTPSAIEDVASMFSIPQVFATKDFETAHSCSTILVGSKATANGSVLLAHNEDNETWDEANACITPHLTHTSGDNFVSYYGALLPEPSETYGYVWWGCPDKDWMPGSFIVGINEHQLTICSNYEYYAKEWLGGTPNAEACIGATQESETDYSGATQKLIWSDFMQLAMERCQTAKEAVQLIGSLVDTYGGDATSPGMMYGMADKNEAWEIETTPHHWAAVRVPDTGYIMRANRYRIDTPDLASSDIESYATSQGWWNGTPPFSFCQAYANSVTGSRLFYDTYREQRVDSLLTPKLGSVRMEDLKAIMRDHYEGLTDVNNPPYYSVDAVHLSPHYPASGFRTLCMERTELSFVAELRNSLPDPIGGLMWATLGCPCTGVFLPYYVGMQSLPTQFMTGLPGETNYDPASAWWTYKRLQNTIDNYYPAAEPHVWQVLDQFEEGAKNDSATVENQALAAYNAGNTQEALSILTTFTSSKLQDGLDLLNGMTTYAYAKTHGLYPPIPGLATPHSHPRGNSEPRKPVVAR